MKAIDELLSSYLDGEITVREQTEVQRLIRHDPQVAKRLRQLSQCRALVAGLPVAKAPQQTMEEITYALERRTLLQERAETAQTGPGARHLFIRKLVAAAAMLALVAALTAVVYTIVAPEHDSDRPVALDAWQQPPEQENREQQISPPQRSNQLRTASTRLTAPVFEGTLELETSARVAVDAFIKKALQDHDFDSRNIPASGRAEKSVYELTGTAEQLKPLLEQLQQIWNRFDTTTLIVQSYQPGGQPVRVEQIAADQIERIVSAPDAQQQVEAASDLAVLNKMAELLPGKALLTAANQTGADLLTVPKPMLTSSRKTVTTLPQKEARDAERLSLTIVVTSGK